MDELSPLFQEIEFHERYRGYDPDEVDAFVDRVARAAAVMRGRISELHERVEAAEARGGATAAHSEAEETLTRTLVLAQRTADAAIAEAREESDRLTADAATSAQAILSAAEAEAQLTLREAQAEASASLKEAEDRAGLMLAEAETDRRALVAQAESAASDAATSERERLAAEVVELHEYRAFLADDIEILERHLTEERHQLSASVSALTDLLESPEAFRVSRPPATSGIQINADRLESIAGEEFATEFAESAEPTDLEPAAEFDTAVDEVAADDAFDAPAEVALAPEFAPTPAPEMVLDGIDESDLDGVEPDESDLYETAHDEFEPAEAEPVVAEIAPDETIDLVAAEAADAAEAAEAADAARAADAQEADARSDETVFYTEVDLADVVSQPDPSNDGPGVGEPSFSEPAFAGMVESSLADLSAPEVAPPRLVTAADLDAPTPTTSNLGFETSTFDDSRSDGGPATQAVPALQDASLFSEPDTADDPFLAQLRDAMDGEPMPPSDDDALSAFFDQEDDDGGRSWFGRRR
jgi:DivIVA domain-containing protein